MATLQQLTPMTEGQTDTVTVGRHNLTIQCVRPDAAYTVTVYQGTLRIDEQCGSYPTQEQAYEIRDGYAEMYRHDHGADVLPLRHKTAKPLTTIPDERSIPRRPRDAHTAGERDARNMVNLIGPDGTAPSQLIDRMAYLGGFISTLVDGLDANTPDGQQLTAALGALGAFRLAFGQAATQAAGGVFVDKPPASDGEPPTRALRLVPTDSAAREEISRRDELVWHPVWCLGHQDACQGYHAGLGTQVPDVDTPGHYASVAPLYERHGTAPGTWGVEITVGNPGDGDSVACLSPDDAERLAATLIHTAQRVREARDSALASI